MKRILAASACALLLVACASSRPVVQTDHAQGTDFSRYRTYTWAEEPQTQSPIVRDKLVRAIDAQLASKGWQRVPDGDVALVGQWVAREDVSYNPISFGVGLGNWGGSSGGAIGASTGTANAKTTVVGSLILDMYDAKSKQAIWRGTVSGDVPQTPETIDAAIAQYIPRMFAGFPPP
jgi:opacity protein-like surface antigen